MCNGKTSSGLLSNLALKTYLSKIPLLGQILFERYKMNEIEIKFLLLGDTFMPEMHLRQPGFNYIACELFPKNKERIQKFKETENSRYIRQNELCVSGWEIAKTLVAESC